MDWILILIEIKKTTKRLADKGFGKDVLTTINTNFRNIDQVAKEHGPFVLFWRTLGCHQCRLTIRKEVLLISMKDHLI